MSLPHAKQALRRLKTNVQSLSTGFKNPQLKCAASGIASNLDKVLTEIIKSIAEIEERV